ncbi:hypothetical protein ISN76_05825 [Dyella halodurans]|uniref:Uncharacterized protein n=1 Tax=Dyella halodurans TaxID=1920171 RepID=A0ABV9C4I0_9GAMM|nr:hypothetical protein [Dyella halodurans]
MTLPNRPQDAAARGAPETSTATQLLTPEELTAIVDAEYQHVDYDLHPLAVPGLDHYIDNSMGDELFHIS